VNENFTEEMLALFFRSRLRRMRRTSQNTPGFTPGEVVPFRIPGRQFLNMFSGVKRIKIGNA